MSKTILKTKSYIPAKMLLEHLPKDYEQMNYLEPAISSLSLLMLKNKSITEIINSDQPDTAAVINALRDEPKTLIGRLKKIKCNETVFKKALSKQEEGFIDYLEQAVNEIVTRKMSRNEAKKTYHQNSHWAELIEIMNGMSGRVKDIFVLQKPIVPVIKAFDDPNTLCYYQLPEESPEAEKEIEKIVLISDQINNFLGKVIVTGEICPLYKRLFKEFKCHKHVKAEKTECLWTNF
jgi:hypothetical protein